MAIIPLVATLILEVLMSRLSTILLRVRDTLADPNAQRYPDALLYRLVTEAQQSLSKVLLNVTKVAVVQTVIGQSRYALPEDLLSLIQVSHNFVGETSSTKLEQLSYLDANLQFAGDWEKNIGTPSYVVFGDLAGSELIITPVSVKPSELRVTYRALAGEIIDAASSLELSPDFDLAIKFYVTGMALRENIDTENRQAGVEELSFYSTELRTLQARLSKSKVTSAVSLDTSYTGAFR